MTNKVNPKSFLLKMLVFIACLLLANLSGIFIQYQFGHDSIYGLIPLFNFDTEMNVPTIYSSLTLAYSAVLLSVIALGHKRTGDNFLLWIGLAAIFVFLSADELLSIHENLIEPVRAAFNTSGLLYYAWVIPYGAAALVFLILYFKFIINLPSNIRMLMIMSGIIYITGAIGFELIGGLQADLHGRINLTYALITTVEELLEMLGIAVFIYALNKHIAHNFDSQALSINPIKL